MVRITMDKTIMKKFGLQWSHVFSDMVSGSLSLSAATCSSLQWSHVFSDMVRTGGDTTADPNAAASMEPCLFRHGKGTVALGKMTQAQLQWSHVFSDMVSCERRSRSACSTSSLQWSHVFSDMVSRSGSRDIEVLELASMEPCLFRHGK